MVYFVGNAGALQMLQYQFAKQSDSIKRLMAISSDNSVLRVVMPLQILSPLLSSTDIHVLINTSTLKYMTEHKLEVDTPKMKIIQHGIKKEKAEDAIKIFDSITNNNMAKLKSKLGII
jgi:hypothetical protein